ncbi:hypothetical protein K458DRAFT_418610 [Lentithecium fluviatile CBS 122367]|uniref:Mis12-domain-containing protein n=1 Tax=Lentithecium fluviatile CBS 122367 TaxID=1168545 RepID=A0A6G1J0A8_9PLEO|nr:hypothetical protein K458DRAFT_418610 [Lentithecium fluviatile CBS 122367]
MASSKQQENLLLTEHFSWPPISLLDEIINTINEVLYRCTDTFETGLLSADPSLLGFSSLYAAQNRVPERDADGIDVYPEARLEIEEGVLKLETLMEGAVDRNFDRLEIWALRNVLCLPREGKEGDAEGGIAGWVRLGGYENLQIPPQDSTLTPEALHALRRKLTETTKLHTALLAEKTRNEAQLARLKSLLQPPTTPKREPRSSTSPPKPLDHNPAEDTAPFAFLTHAQAAQTLGIQPLLQSSNMAAAPESRTPLTTHTTFTTSQLPYLRQLLATLKPHLATTALPSHSTSEKDEWAKERRVYVESQSKRVLERRGVDTVDGVEGAVDGARVRSEEIRGLEGIVAATAGRSQRREDTAEAAQDGDVMDTS